MKHERFDAFGEVFFALCKSINTPRSLGLWLRYRSKIPPWDQSFSPRDYNDEASFAKDYYVRSFISKYKGLDFGVDTRKAAIQTFEQSEVKCSSTNKTIKDMRAGVLLQPDVDAIISMAQRKISRILGPCPLSSTRHSCWTTGAALDLRRSHAQPDNKIVQLPITVTSRAASLLALHINTDPHWFEAISGILPEGPYSVLPDVFKIVRGGRYDTVPKNAKTDRSIIVEPRGNMFLQKGVGNFIRQRLSRVGCDLNDQSVNQSLARFAFDFGLCTVDLEAASDTISLELVHYLLPVDWANYLGDLRSPSVLLPDSNYEVLKKFSSMGNGFTFELESLIFFALSQSVVDVVSPGGSSFVYGDDIIVPNECYPLLAKVFEAVGFLINREKTFAEGNFYESCGRHFFRGVDVTPIYQKEVLDEVEAIRCGNRIFRSQNRLPFLSSRLSSPYKALRRIFTLYKECEVPSFYQGDDGWLVEDYEAKLPWSRNNGFHCNVLRRDLRYLPGNDVAWLAYSLRQDPQPKIPTYLGIRRDGKEYYVRRTWINRIG